LGADVSSLPKWIKQGQKYYDASGKETAPLTLLKSVGVNHIRLRIWNNPSDGHSGKAEVLAFAKEVKAAGMKLMIDFHYSDSWADPGKQTKPAAWSSHTIDTLVKDVHDYTLDICNSLKSQGTAPDSVQIGNEINVGMLWNDGKVTNNNFAPLGKLLNAGYEAMRSCDSSTKVVIHVADADSDANARWFFDGIKSQNVSYDIIGLSYYCFWHGTTSNLQSVISDLKSRYGKPVWVVETAFTTTADGSNASSEKCTGFDSTPAGQTKNGKTLRLTPKVVARLVFSIGNQLGSERGLYSQPLVISIQHLNGPLKHNIHAITYYLTNLY